MSYQSTLQAAHRGGLHPDIDPACQLCREIVLTASRKQKLPPRAEVRAAMEARDRELGVVRNLAATLDDHTERTAS